MSHTFDFDLVQPKEPGEGSNFSARCLDCNKHLWSGDGTMWADRNGIPFAAYYCTPCKERHVSPSGRIRNVNEPNLQNVPVRTEELEPSHQKHSPRLGTTADGEVICAECGRNIEDPQFGDTHAEALGVTE